MRGDRRTFLATTELLVVMVAIAALPSLGFSQVGRPAQNHLNSPQGWKLCRNAQAGYRFEYPSTWVGTCSDSVRIPSSLDSCDGLDCPDAMSFMVEKAPDDRNDLKAAAAVGWKKSTVSCAGQQADAYTANDGSTHVWVRGSAGWFALHFNPVRDARQAAPVFRRIVASFAFFPIDTSQNAYPSAAAPYRHLAKWSRHGSGTGYFSCQDVCKQRPKRYRTFWMDARWDFGSHIQAAFDKDRELARKLIEILHVNGWHKCKSIRDESTGDATDTYAQGDGFFRLESGCSRFGSCAVNIAMTTSRLPELQPPTSNPTVAITPDWRTYRNASFGFQISYPPYLRVNSVVSGYGAITNLGDCYKKNCLRMSIDPDKWARDALYIQIAPEEIWTGVPCPPGITRGGTLGFAPDGTPYSSCTTFIGPRPKPSTEYAIGRYPTFAEQWSDSGWETCSRTLTLWTTVGAYRYQFRPVGSVFLLDSFHIKDIYRKILSTVRIRPVHE